MSAHDLIVAGILVGFGIGMAYVSGAFHGGEWRQAWQAVREMHGMAVEPARELARAARKARKRRTVAS